MPLHEPGPAGAKSSYRWLVLLLFLGIVRGGDLFAAEPEGSLASLPAAIHAAIDGFSGEVYFAAKNLADGRTLSYRPAERVQTASVIKVPIMAEAFAQVKEGRLSWSRRIRVSEDDRVPGAGILQDLEAGAEISLLDAVTLMIVLSDNTATNLVIDRVGIDAVNRRLASLGLEETFLNKKVFRPPPLDLPEERARFGLGVTTAGEMLSLMECLGRKELVDAESSEKMLSILQKQRDREQIPRYLTSPEWKDVRVANKTGALNALRNDVGVVFTPWGDCVLSLFAQESQDEKWTADNEAALCLARLSRAILEEFRSPSAP